MVIYQNCLALDYLLAKKGNSVKSSAVQTVTFRDDSGQAVEDIASNIRKPAHVPVQTWKGMKGWDPISLFGGWLSTSGGFKSLVGMVGIML